MRIKKKRATINFDEDILKKIDKKRGLISRSAFINKLLKDIERRFKNEI